MQTRKFWCHYIGSDGNTPKRRSIELHNLADLVPNIPDNVHCETPVWYEQIQNEDYVNNYYLFIQLSDKVALSAPFPLKCIGDEDVELMMKSDEQIADEYHKWLKELREAYPQNYKGHEKESAVYIENGIKDDIRRRDRKRDFIKVCQNYTKYLLGENVWISTAILKAYAEINSPFLSTLQTIRKKDLELREEEERKRREEMRKREEEEKQRQIEAEKKEQERLTEVAKKLKQGEHIKGCDVVSLCRRYGIKVHLRTVHNLQQVVLTINTNDAYTQPGEKAKLDGCFKTVTELYDYLQEHDAA